MSTTYAPTCCALPAAQLRALREKVAAEPRAVYGINTGFGKLASIRIGADDLEALQRNIVLSHAAGVGAPRGHSGEALACGRGRRGGLSRGRRAGGCSIVTQPLSPGPFLLEGAVARVKARRGLQEGR